MKYNKRNFHITSKLKKATAVNADNKIESPSQKSCGAIIYRISNKNIEYLLLFQRRSQTWSFPKGHMEEGETEIETAKREVYEETGLDVRLSSDFREEVSYKIANSTKKVVVLFLCETKSEPIIRKDEILEYRWVNASDAQNLLYPEYNPVIKKVENMIKNNTAQLVQQ